MSRKKLCIYNMGGSIGMRYDHKRKALENSEIISGLLQYIPELQKDFSIDVKHLFTGNSYDVSPDHWKELVDAIMEDYDRYDGFVVLHGTSTMTYTASYTSFALQQLAKPVVFTGSIHPLQELGSEGRNNIINACLTATMDIAEVVITYGTLVLRANRAVKTIENYSNVFTSPNFQPLGEIKRPMELSEMRKKRRKRVLKVLNSCSPRVLSLQVTPGLSAETLEQIGAQNINGLVLEGYGAGVIPSHLENSIRALVDAEIPVVLTSQMHHGIATPLTYNSSTNLHDTDMIFGYDMTTAALVTKLMWATAQETSLSKIRAIMHTDIAGELREELTQTAKGNKY